MSFWNIKTISCQSKILIFINSKIKLFRNSIIADIDDVKAVYKQKWSIC